MSIQKDPRDVILRPIVSEKSYSLIDRGSYSKWLAGDQRTFNERLHAKTAHILETHPDVEFAPEIVAEMDRICDAAMKRVGA